MYGIKRKSTSVKSKLMATRERKRNKRKSSSHGGTKPSTKHQAKHKKSNYINDLESDHQSEITDTKSHKDQLASLKDTDPEFYQYLVENDDKLLKFSESEDELNSASDMEENIEQQDEEEYSSDGRDDDDGSDGNMEPDSDTDAMNDDSDDIGDDDNNYSGKSFDDDVQLVTVEMVHSWSQNLSQHYSVKALKQLCLSLHCGVVSFMSSTDKNTNPKSEQLCYQVKGAQVFNAIVTACLRSVRPTLDHHFSSLDTSQKPSSLKIWSSLKVIVKTYLLDMLQLLRGSSQSSMICAVLRHVEALWMFVGCFPKIARLLSRELIGLWSEKSEEVALLAYLMLRKVVMNLNDYKLEDIMKRMYLSYIRNSRLTTPSTVLHIKFMCGTLVELLSFSPNLAYQLVFLYTRQLANQLRTVFKGSKTVGIATWPFLHSLEFFCSFLSTLTDDVFSPLVYPVVQVSVGVVQLLNASKYTPLRLHIANMVLEITEKRGTFIPIAPILLEIFETQAIAISRKQATGKLPSLSCTLKLSKIQIGSRSTQTAVLNYALELLLRLLAHYSTYISFPEIVFPITTRLRKVMKKTPLTWLRHHLKQIIEKVNEVSRSIISERSTVDFSPKDEEKIKSWETIRGTQKNPIRKFYETWKVIQQQSNSDEQNDKEESNDMEQEEETLDRNKDREAKQISGKKRKRGSSDDAGNNNAKQKPLPVLEWCVEEDQDIVQDIAHFTSSDEEGD